jgi:hypothetical protein
MVNEENSQFIGIDLAKPDSDISVETLILPGEGIYFNMSFDEYKALPYFSRSLAKKVRFDLEEARYYQEHGIEETSAMALGTAIHSMFLEPEDFDRIYVRDLSFKDFPGKVILDTNKELENFLASVGEKKSGMKKEELIAKVEPWLDPNKYVIWDKELKKFYEKAALNKQQILSNEDFETMIGLRASFAKRKYLPETIKGGYAEVTIIWKDAETGIMCKCRVDYLRPTVITDVKSFSVTNEDKSLFEYLFNQTTRKYYNFQFAIYSEALETIIKKIRANQAKVHGDVAPEWLEKFLENSKKQFFILYVRTAAPYQMKAIELERAGAEGATPNEYYSVAKNIWRETLKKYSQALKSGIWTEKEVETLGDEHVRGVEYQASIY